MATRRKTLSIDPAEARRLEDQQLTELMLWQDNTEPLYRQELAIRANLARKMMQQKYRNVDAPKAWMYLADATSKSYAKEFGLTGHAFPISVRRAASKYWARDFENEALRAGTKFLHKQIENTR